MTVPSAAAAALTRLLPSRTTPSSLSVRCQQLRGERGAAVAGLDQVLQPVAVERHHAGFGDREEGGEEQEDDEGEQQVTAARFRPRRDYPRAVATAASIELRASSLSRKRRGRCS